MWGSRGDGAGAGVGAVGGVGRGGGGGDGAAGGIVPLVVLQCFVTFVFLVGGPGFSKHVPLLL